MGKSNKIKLDVLICSFGPDGLNYLAKHLPPTLEGVRYVVSWQLPDGDVPIPVELNRDDIEIYKYATRGLSCNRNQVLSHIQSEYGLIADDDQIFLPEGLKEIISYLDSNPDVDIITGRFIGNPKKNYPTKSFDLSRPPKGYYVSSIEIAFRSKSVKSAGVVFDQRFGVGTPFKAYEEVIWLHQMMQKGLKGVYLPIDIAEHQHPTTSEQLSSDLGFIEGKGAMMRIIHPFTWPLRMILHSLPDRRPQGVTACTFISAWLKGASAM